ncbi:F0F1 ATP synthase subunit B [bacterium]|nr:F0F1 ATP synthase subunit B [FCB group bacterium]MBL7191756.1 F0F1 ATP synthase subunit B [bacterium]
MLLQLHPGLMIWTIITFLVLVIVLRVVAWKPILAMLEARENKIRGDLDNARSEREKAEKITVDLEKRLQEARKEAYEIIAMSRQAAESVREETIENARKDSALMVERAKAEIQLEREKTAQALRAELSGLVIAAAAQIIGKKLSPEEHLDLIRKTIEEVK